MFKNDKLNPDAVKQISFGGILGLGLGVLFSMFSRMLVLLVGVGIVFWQVSLRHLTSCLVLSDTTFDDGTVPPFYDFTAQS